MLFDLPMLEGGKLEEREGKTSFNFVLVVCLRLLEPLKTDKRTKRGTCSCSFRFLPFREVLIWSRPNKIDLPTLEGALSHSDSTSSILFGRDPH